MITDIIHVAAEEAALPDTFSNLLKFSICTSLSQNCVLCATFISNEITVVDIPTHADSCHCHYVEHFSLSHVKILRVSK
jgi:hypothetical protein